MNGCGVGKAQRSGLLSKKGPAEANIEVGQKTASINGPGRSVGVKGSSCSGPSLAAVQWWRLQGLQG